MGEDWQERLKEIMIKGDQEVFSPECISIRTENCPDRLYKYCSFSDDNLDSLENGYLYLSNIDRVNDPLECFVEAGNDRVNLVKSFFTYWKQSSILFPTQSSKDDFCKKIEAGASFKSEFLNLLFDKLPRVYPYIVTNHTFQERADEIDNHDTEMASIIKNTIGDHLYIGCLSSRNDIITMWSYYANNHKGFVIEYEIPDELKKYVFPVYYVDKPIDFYQYKKSPCSYYLLCLKFEEWTHEKEWRIIRGSDSGHKFPIQAKALYHGFRSYDKYAETQSVDNAIQLARIIDKLQIPTFKMTLDKSNYRLISVPVFKPKS